MRSFLLGAIVGAIIIGACIFGWWVLDGGPRAQRVLDDLGRARSEVISVQGELETSQRELSEVRARLDESFTELGKLRTALERSQGELGKLRGILSRGSTQIDESLTGIDRLRAILQGLPAIRVP